MKYFSEPKAFIGEEIAALSLPKELGGVLAKLRHPRRGWVKRGVNEEGKVEFALQHTAKAVKAASVLNAKKWQVDKEVVGSLLLVHELPEIIVPDFTPSEITTEELRAREWLAMEKILPIDFPERNKILGIWGEFDEKITTEARMAFALDKTDAFVSAQYYALANPVFQPVADEFFEYNSSKVDNSGLKRVVTEVRDRCRKLVKSLEPRDAFEIYFDLLGR